MKIHIFLFVGFLLSSFNQDSCLPENKKTKFGHSISYIKKKEKFKISISQGKIHKEIKQEFECDRNWSQKPRYFFDNKEIVVLMNGCGSSCQIYTICNFKDPIFTLFKAEFDKERSIAAYFESNGDFKTLIFENLLTRKKQNIILKDLVKNADPVDGIIRIDFFKNKVHIDWESAKNSKKTNSRNFELKIS